MKKYLFILLLFSSFSVWCQNIEKIIVLKDADSNLPIDDATVTVMKTRQNAITNTEGEVQIILKGSSNITITHPSYLKQIIRSINLSEGINYIFLKKQILSISNLVLTKQHPTKILKNLIENSTKTLTMPARLKVYTREFFKLNGNYTYYNDGIVNFQITGNPQKMDAKILVEQNRSLGVVEDGYAEDLQGYNLNNLMANYYNFKYLLPLIASNSKKTYDFLIKSHPDNENLYIMTAWPLAENDKLLDEFTIIYDNNRKLIVEISTTISPLSLKNVDSKSFGFDNKKIYRSVFKTNYSIEDDKYYLLSSKEEIGFEKKNSLGKNDIEVRNYFITSNFSNQGYSFKTNDLFTEKTLHLKKNLVLTNYWDTSGLKTTDEEQIIINKLTEKMEFLSGK